MGLDVWFQEDVARALRAARVAGHEARREGKSVGTVFGRISRSPVLFAVMSITMGPSMCWI